MTGDIRVLIFLCLYIYIYNIHIYIYSVVVYMISYLLDYIQVKKDDFIDIEVCIN